VDAAFDPGGVGGGLIGAVRDDGRFVAATAVGLPAAERGIDVREVRVRSDGALLARIFRIVASGALTTRIGATVPLAEAARAHTMAASRAVRGKIVLTL
jgi:NADPH:quinone reductase-like Zn-dependent oxidoreductase